MYTLYWEHMAGSIVVQATLEALNADYRMQYVDMGAGQHLKTDFLKLNPAARIPALSLPGGTTIGETGAIVTLLGEVHAESPVTPQPGDADRGAFLFWLNVMSTAGYVTSSRVGHPERFARDDSAIAQVEAQGDKDFAEFFNLMDRSIAGDVYFLRRGLTALDFYVTMLSEWVSDRQALLVELPRLRKLCSAVRETPAYRTALETHKMPAFEEAD
ncbi:glutathione S-transferase family protein [Tropicimonas sp. IMCC6043]|uniref:glutathione S-transferase family protein n=1 Tax=Tropicimonas sp. IMCC6043 TaxID=2510645 RepID=UPI00101D058A|nr:glutathione S-transferase family protein [Tropicimonas sp. IMCC6043]RYH06016.1 glutathione S-transferase family protein [Tropicimonas sp. IMCC6043]